VPEYNGLVEHLASGPCLALELMHAAPSSAPIGPHVRQLCGPHDPAIARTLRPNTIRARFGTDKVHNAVHCTDLVDDGPLESEFLFKIMQ
jgi:nucleoside-diphosphate kinase